jgi:hypothetical protein
LQPDDGAESNKLAKSWMDLCVLTQELCSRFVCSNIPSAIIASAAFSGAALETKEKHGQRQPPSAVNWLTGMKYG